MAESNGKGIRIAIITLPLGLFVLGLATMIYSHIRPKAPELEDGYYKHMQAASLNRRDINQEDLQRYVNILTDEVGERHLGEADSLERAAIWIESTLKGRNWGYQLSRHTYSMPDGSVVRNIVAELPGEGTRKNKREIVVLGAHYDTAVGDAGANDNASGVAALLALAQDFASRPQRRTLRFVFSVNDAAPHYQTEHMGSLVYAKACEAEGQQIVTMLAVDSVGQLPMRFSADELSRYWADTARSAYQRGSGLEAVSEVGPGSSSEWAYRQVGYAAALASGGEGSDVDIKALEKVCLGLEEIINVWTNP